MSLSDKNSIKGLNIVSATSGLSKELSLFIAYLCMMQKAFVQASPTPFQTSTNFFGEGSPITLKIFNPVHIGPSLKNHLQKLSLAR